MPDPTQASEPDNLTSDQNEAASYVVDRLEDADLVILEDEQGRSLTVPRAWLPNELGEGDVVVVEQQELISEDEAGFTTSYRGLDVYVDHAATQARRERADDLRNSLPKGPEGDLSL